MIKTPWRLAGRLLARDWRSGEVLVLLAALVVAVAAMSAVTFFTDRVRSAVSQQAGEALAADLRVESINPLPDEMRDGGDAARARDGRHRELSQRRGGRRHDLAGRRARRDGELSAARRRAGRRPRWPARPQNADGYPGARRGLGRAEPHGAPRRRGRRRARSRPAAAHESRGRSSFGPTKAGASWRSRRPCCSTTTTCCASGLLAPGSIAEFAGSTPARPPQLEAFRADLVPLLRPQDEVEDFRDGRPEVRAAVGNAERFLVLAALVSVLLGGVAVAMAARRFVARRLDAVALMKCLGARHREVLRLNVLQLLILVVAAGVIGCVDRLRRSVRLDGVARRLHRSEAAAGELAGRRARAADGAWPSPSAARCRRCCSSAACRRRACCATTSGRRRCATRRSTASRQPPSPALLYVLFGDFELIAYLLGGHGRHVLRAVLRRAVARAGAAAVSRRRRRRLALRYRERRAPRPREQRAGGRVRHRSHGAAAADVGAHGADDGVAGDAAGERAESLSH